MLEDSDRDYLLDFTPLPQNVRKTMLTTCTLNILCVVVPLIVLGIIVVKYVDLRIAHNVYALCTILVFLAIFAFFFLRKSIIFYSIANDATSEFIGDQAITEALRIVEMFPEKYVDLSSIISDGYVSIVHGGGYVITINKGL